MNGENRFSPAEFAARMRKESGRDRGAPASGDGAGAASGASRTPVASRTPGADSAAGAARTAGAPSSMSAAAQTGGEDDFDKLAEEIRAYLSAPRGLTEDERRQYGETLNRAVLGFPQEREQVLAVIEDRLIRLHIHDQGGWSHPYATLAEALFAEVVGLNVLELVLAEKSGLEEIQVVGTRIYEVRDGRTLPSAYAFDSVKDVERIQQNLVLYNNDRISPRKRWAEVMLRDGSRVTMTGFGFTASPTLTIRFYTVHSFSLAALAMPAFRTMNKRLAVLLRAALAARFNLVIIGPTNSGKTNLMKALIAELPEEERIITIEGRFEMMLGRDFPGRNIVEYEASEEDAGHGSSQAFKLALRQSPRRIIHAEIRDEDANIYVRACTRGHSGSMTTVHANRLEDVPEAITDMCMLDGRAMNAERLTKRITEYVTELGIEMKLCGGRRVIARIGELSWQDGEPKVRDWAWFDEGSGDWLFPGPPSEKAAARLAAAGYAPGTAGRHPDRETSREAVGPAAKEAMQETLKVAAKAATRETSEEAAREIQRETPEEAAREIQRETPEEAAKEMPREKLADMGQGVPPETLRNAASEAMREADGNTAREVLRCVPVHGAGRAWEKAAGGAG